MDESNFLAPVNPASVRGNRTWFISRHVGALEWAKRRQIRVDCCAHHLDIARLQPGDVVIGTLPAHLAAAVCAHGARYVHLAIDVEAFDRGRELSAEELDATGARLVPLFVSAGH